MGYFAQHAMEVLLPDRSVWDTLVDVPRASVGWHTGARRWAELERGGSHELSNRLVFFRGPGLVDGGRSRPGPECPFNSQRRWPERPRRACGRAASAAATKSRYRCPHGAYVNRAT
jgi:hypothetical protein